MKPRVVRSEADYAEALRSIDALLDADPGTPEGDDLDVWITLVEVYEDEHHAIDAPNPIDAIRFRMEQLGLRQIDLAPLLGGRSRVSEVLSGKRSLTINMIRALHARLGIPLPSLVGTPTNGPSTTPEGHLCERWPSTAVHARSGTPPRSSSTR
jgi:HTH-type transcriptional regulator/antitoxin HigA